MLYGLKGVPLKVDKLQCLGTPEEVCKSIMEISKSMKKPMVMRCDDNIAIFDLYIGEIELEAKWPLTKTKEEET